MEEVFKNWLIKRGYSETGAANSYSRAIHQISQHYSKNENKTIDIYTITNQEKISEISHSYSQSGIYSKFGYEQHSRFRNAKVDLLTLMVGLVHYQQVWGEIELR